LFPLHRCRRCLYALRGLSLPFVSALADRRPARRRREGADQECELGYGWLSVPRSRPARRRREGAEERADSRPELNRELKTIHGAGLDVGQTQSSPPVDPSGKAFDYSAKGETL
jgi:hypothetical protein